MITVYSLLKLLHILLAIVAVGFNASYAIWIARAARESQHMGHVLRGIKFLDDRFANPGYGLLLVTGLAMAFVGNLPLTTFWIAAALVLWFVVLVLGIGFYTPTLRRQIAVLDEKGAASDEFQRLSRRASIVGLVTMVPILLILFLMVVKPTL
ncbi:MAG: DUF2269 family protein [Anaerolineae bacterium]